MNREPLTFSGRAPAPTLEIPPYLETVFTRPDLLARAKAIAAIVADEDPDTALAALAWLADRASGWSRQILDAAGWLLLHEQRYMAATPAPAGWEARRAA
jgi:hypothetical protein